MPVKHKRSPPDSPEERWVRTSGDYARTVRNHGSGTSAAREAWKCAKQALDDLVEEDSQSDEAAGKAS